MDAYKVYDRLHGYNLSSTAGVTKLSQESIEKIRRANTGRMAWNKGRPSGIIPWNKGKPWPQEMCERMSKARKGKPTGRKGIPVSIETKLKIAESQKKRLASPIIREKMRLAKLGKKCAPYKSGNAIKTHCPRGHPYSGDNLYIHPKSKRRGCKACINIAYKKSLKNRRLP